MPRLNRTYTLRLANGQDVPLKATNLADVHKEVLAHFGATISHQDTPGRTAQHWNALVSDVQRGSQASRDQVEGLLAFRGLGIETCKKLIQLAGKATDQNVLPLLRGHTRWRVDEVVAILNAAVKK